LEAACGRVKRSQQLDLRSSLTEGTKALRWDVETAWSQLAVPVLQTILADQVAAMAAGTVDGRQGFVLEAKVASFLQTSFEN